ncbi:MAG: hypothetical protein AAGF14_10400 [Pseudomonadota bacterium]
MTFRIPRLAALAAMVALLTLAPAEAKELKVSGINTYVPTESDVTPLTDEANLLRTKSRSVLVTEDTELPFYLSTQDCAGTYLLDANGQVDTGYGYCDVVDDDNDIWWLSWETKGDDGTWQVLGGTGKYEGMTGKGTSKVLSQSADGRFALRWEGTAKMK